MLKLKSFAVTGGFCCCIFYVCVCTFRYAYMWRTEVKWVFLRSPPPWFFLTGFLLCFELAD